MLRDLRSSGTAIVYISHRLKEIEALADRAVVLRDGRNAGVLHRGEITRDRLVQLMVGRAIDAGGRPRDARRGTPADAPPPRGCSVDRMRTRRYPGRRGVADRPRAARCSASPG